MIPTKDKNIIVGVKHKNSFKWYLTPKSLWIFDLSKINPGERIKYAKDIVQYRSNLDIISKDNYNQFIASIHELKIDTMQLKTDMLDMTIHLRSAPINIVTGSDPKFSDYILPDGTSVQLAVAERTRGGKTVQAFYLYDAVLYQISMIGEKEKTLLREVKSMLDTVDTEIGMQEK